MPTLLDKRKPKERIEALERQVRRLALDTGVDVGYPPFPSPYTLADRVSRLEREYDQLSFMLALLIKHLGLKVVHTQPETKLVADEEAKW